jgi:hypothetical protein
VAEISRRAPEFRRPKASHALPPRKNNSIQRTSLPLAPVQPLLPGAKAGSPASNSKLPSLALGVADAEVDRGAGKDAERPLLHGFVFRVP